MKKKKKKKDNTVTHIFEVPGFRGVVTNTANNHSTGHVVGPTIRPFPQVYSRLVVT